MTTPPPTEARETPDDGAAPAGTSSAVDTGCSIGIGCTILTLVIMAIGIAIIVATRW